MNQTISELVAQAWAVKQQRAALAKANEELKSQQSALEQSIIEGLQQIGASVAESDLATATLTMKGKVVVNDEKAFRLHIIQSGEIDLLENRPARANIAARWQSGEQIPGLMQAQEAALSLTKRKA